MMRVIGMSESMELSRKSLPYSRPGSSSSKKRCRNEVCTGSMPTSSDCSQLQSIMPLKAMVWVAGAMKQSKCGKDGGSSGPRLANRNAHYSTSGYYDRLILVHNTKL